VHNNLRRLREAKGWTQFYLSRRAGIHASVVSNVEHGRLVPWPKLKTRISRALGCPVEDIFPVAAQQKEVAGIAG
jgi:transcriptional regulator with XRE-family HTH domain